jgi:hypothetical protein
LTQNNTQSIQEKPSAQSSLIAKRIHPFLANRKLQVKKLNNAENSNDGIKLPATRHPFFKTKATRKSLVNIDTLPAGTDIGNESDKTEISGGDKQESEVDDLKEDHLPENQTKLPTSKKSNLQKLLSLRASGGKSNTKITNAANKLKSSINSKKSSLVGKRISDRPKFSLSSRFKQKKKLLSELSQKLQTSDKPFLPTTITNSKSTTPSVIPTTSSTRSTSRFRPFGKTLFTSKFPPSSWIDFNISKTAWLAPPCKGPQSAEIPAEIEGNKPACEEPTILTVEVEQFCS